MKPKYSVIVPAYSEATIIDQSLKRLAKAFKNEGIWEETELVVVTAESTDDTAKIVKKNRHLFKYFQLIEPGKKVGKGRDVRAGVLSARGKYILFTDADLATPTRHIRPAFSYLEEGFPLVIGVRPLSKIHNSFSRRLRSVLSNYLIQLLAVPGVSDTQCGFKGFSRSAAIKLFEPLQALAWGFDIEILARAKQYKYRIKQLEITDWYDPKIGKMGLAGESDIQANLRTLKELINISYRKLTGKLKTG